MKKLPIKEKLIQQVVLEWLAINHIFAWRQNSGSFKTDKGGWYKAGIAGAPDIFALHGGVMYGLEVKNEKGKLNDNQKAFQSKFEEAGGQYHVVRSVEDVTRIFI